MATTTKEEKGKMPVRGTASGAKPTKNGVTPSTKRKRDASSSTVETTKSKGGNGKGNSHKARPRSSSSASTSKSKPANSANKKPRYGGERPSGLQGASKLKSSIRQTKRLLSKPNLAPGVQIEAQRRLKSLQHDLDQLQHFKQTKKLAGRYHGLKFFERQKLVRKIRQTKTQLASLNGKTRQEGGSDSDSSDSEQSDSDSESESESGSDWESHPTNKHDKSTLETSLQTYRELLHYVLRFPPDSKYVALFPDGRKTPLIPTSQETDKSRQIAYQHLLEVQNGMRSGSLSNQPEVELQNKERRMKNTTTTTAATTIKTQQPKNNQLNTPKSSTKNNQTSAQSKKPSRPPTAEQETPQGLVGDDFFAQDSDDEDD